VVLFVRKAATPETSVVVTSLAEADPAQADMRTLVIIGAAATRLIPRAGHRPWVYTPRAETGMAR
jgi:precorrin-3B C17-methyltransferase